MGARSPQVGAIWVVVPFSRPENFARVLSNFARQRFAGKKLVVVANGPAASSTFETLGAIRASLIAHWITSSAHQSHARNEGLAFVRKQGGGFVAFMDDDDWYGPGYLDEIAGYAKAYGGIGKQWHFVSLGEGLPDAQLLLCNRLNADQESSWLTGGTLACWAEDAVDFELCPGEDLRWCTKMMARGAKLRALSIYHYLYRRSYAFSEHTWTQPRESFVKAVRATTLEFPPLPDGGIDLDLVSGDKYPTHGRMLGKGEFVPLARPTLAR